MSESCPKCGSQKLHPDDRYFICGADSHGQYSGPENCWETDLAAATKRADDLQATADQWKSEAERLRSLGVRQQQEIETLGEMADAVERLREIGRATGCDHVDDPDGRTRIVRCVEEVIAAAEQRAEEAEAKLAQSTNYVADDDTYPTCVWFANGRVVSVNAAGVLEIRFGKQLEACDER